MAEEEKEEKGKNMDKYFPATQEVYDYLASYCERLIHNESLEPHKDVPSGGSKIDAIKWIRSNFPHLGIKSSKDLFDGFYLSWRFRSDALKDHADMVDAVMAPFFDILYPVTSDGYKLAMDVTVDVRHTFCIGVQQWSIAGLSEKGAEAIRKVFADRDSWI